MPQHAESDPDRLAELAAEMPQVPDGSESDPAPSWLTESIEPEGDSMQVMARAVAATGIRSGGSVVNPKTGKTVSWTPIEPVADEYDAAKALGGSGFSCLGVIGNASHLRGSGGHTPWCSEGYGGKSCKPGRVYAIDLHLPDPAGTFLSWLRGRLKSGYYGWVYYLNFGGHQITRVDAWKGTYSSGDQHLHLSGLAGHENDNSSILRDWETHRTGTTTSTEGFLMALSSADQDDVGYTLGVTAAAKTAGVSPLHARLTALEDEVSYIHRRNMEEAQKTQTQIAAVAAAVAELAAKVTPAGA